MSMLEFKNMIPWRKTPVKKLPPLPINTLIDHLEKMELVKELSQRSGIIASIMQYFYWHLKFGETIAITWPPGVEPDKIWRLWLETNVGRQGHDWDWRAIYPEAIRGGYKIQIKFRNPAHASHFLLIFGTHDV